MSEPTPEPPFQFESPSPDSQQQARARGEKFGLGRGGAHFFLCVGPDCCSSEFGLGVWQFLKSRTRALEPELGGETIYRTKAACLRICRSLGPTMVVYPSGRWYHRIDEAACERVLQFELFGRGHVEDLQIGSSDERPSSPATPPAPGQAEPKR